jgi:hypothetical protein
VSESSAIQQLSLEAEKNYEEAFDFKNQRTLESELCVPKKELGSTVGVRFESVSTQNILKSVSVLTKRMLSFSNNKNQLKLTPQALAIISWQTTLVFWSLCRSSLPFAFQVYCAIGFLSNLH